MYDAALKSAKKAEETSDLQSEAERGRGFRRYVMSLKRVALYVHTIRSYCVMS